MQLFKIIITIFILATNVATAFSLSDLSKGQSGGTEAYFIVTRRDFYQNLLEKTTQKHKMIVKQRVRAQRGNKAAKLISALSKISFQKNIETGMKPRSRFNRLKKFHNWFIDQRLSLENIRKIHYCTVSSLQITIINILNQSPIILVQYLELVTNTNFLQYLRFVTNPKCIICQCQIVTHIDVHFESYNALFLWNSEKINK